METNSTIRCKEPTITMEFPEWVIQKVIIGFPQGMIPGQSQAYSMPPNYQSEIYPSHYNPPKNYPFEYTPSPPTSIYSEFQSPNMSFGKYSGNEMGTRENVSGQLDYARSFAQTPYSGFYSDPLFGTFGYL